jgi:uncharacterized protein (DUF1810 family)
MTTQFDLDRFVDAQQPVMASVLRELTEGKKCTHWMWFVFPQLAGLGHSPMAQRYAISTLAEAQAYLDHPHLGPRLIALTEVVNRLAGLSIHQIFGSPDDMKFHSSMTLFALARPREPAFRAALQKYFDARPDPRTTEMLRSQADPS